MIPIRQDVIVFPMSMIVPLFVHVSIFRALLCGNDPIIRDGQSPRLLKLVRTYCTLSTDSKFSCFLLALLLVGPRVSSSLAFGLLWFLLHNRRWVGP